MSVLTAVVTGLWSDVHTWGDAAEECSTNGDFTSGDTAWTKSSGWTIVDQGGGDYEAVAINTTGSLSQAPLTTKRLQSGRIYTTTFTITSYTGGTLALKLGGTAGTTRSSAGTFTEDITAGANGFIEFDAITTLNCRIDDISVKIKTEEYPQAGDTVTIPADVTVTYDVDSTDELANVTVTGTLTWKTDANTELRCAATYGLLGTGTVNIGTSLAPVDAAYTAKVGFAVVANNTGGIVMSTGSVLNVHGDPAYYGDDFDTTLQANWTSGQTFTVVGNFSAKWRSGQKIHVYKNATYSSYATDVVEFTLDGAPSNAANSVCTIVEAAPGVTFNAGGYVLNVSRNVIIAKTSGSRAMGFAETTAQRFTAFSVTLSSAELGNFYRAAWNTSPVVTKCVFRNFNNGVFYTATTPTASDCCAWSSGGIPSTVVAGLTQSGTYNWGENGQTLGIASTTSGSKYFGSSNLNPSRHNRITSCTFVGIGAIASALHCTFTDCDFTKSSGLLQFYYTGYTTFYNCFFYGNATAIGVGTNAPVVNHNARFVGGAFGYDRSLASVPNTTADININGSGAILASFIGVKSPAAGWTIVGLNSGLLSSRFGFQDYAQVAGAALVLDGAGSLSKVSTPLRAGGASYSVEVLPASGCAALIPIVTAMWTEDHIAASEQTRTIYVRGLNWASWPTAAQLWLEVEYIAGATAETVRTLIKSTQVLTDNTTWVALTVTFTPGCVSSANYRICLEKYAATCGVYVDAALYNGSAKKEVSWVDGEPVVAIDYSWWTSAAASTGGIPIFGGKAVRRA